MRLGRMLRRHWPQALLIVAVILPWLALLALGILWLWQHSHFWVWAVAAAALALLAWPLTRLAKRRIKVETHAALGDRAEPSRDWNVRERETWSEVEAIADRTNPFSFTKIDPLLDKAREVIEAVARRLHPESRTPWAQFTFPELLLLTERVSKDLRQEALRSIPGIRNIKFGHALWLKQMVEGYGSMWTVGYNIWRVVRGVWDPAAAVGREISRVFDDNVATAVVDGLRARVTKEFVLNVGRAAIDLYSGRLVLSELELGLARERDKGPAAVAVRPVRILLVGQVNAGKSSLVNALQQETRSAVGPLPTTARAAEHQLELEARPAVSLVDMPGLGDDGVEQELRAQSERADLVVASATQPARSADRQALDDFRAWARTQLTRRPPRVILALTHIDELRPASEWTPPYDIGAPAGPKARNILAAIHSVASALDLPADAIVPVALPPGSEPYNLDALWARIAVDLDDARLVQLDRLRISGQGTSLRELATQLGRAGRFIIEDRHSSI